MALHEDLIGLYKETVNLSNEDRIALAIKNWKPIFDWVDGLDNLSNESKGAFFVFIFRYFVSADKNATDGEYEMFKAITNCDYDSDTFYELTNHGSDPKFMEAFEGMCNAMPQDVKVNVATVGLCILAADDSLTGAEQDLFERFLSSNE